jgi:hypothetical protein
MAMAQGLPDPGAPETGAPEAVPAQSGTEPAAKKASKPKDSEDAKWMAYLDEQRGGEGFVAWKAFDHPQLGSVEIGGFAPGVKHNPPSGEADGLAEGQAAFVADVLSRLAEIKVGSPVVERVSAGLYRVSVSVMNTGELPTVNTMGEKTRRLPPEVIEIDLPATSIVGGTKLVRMSGIEGGDTRHAEWLVAAGDGSSARLLLRSPRFGDREMEVRFGN